MATQQDETRAPRETDPTTGNGAVPDDAPRRDGAAKPDAAKPDADPPAGDGKPPVYKRPAFLIIGGLLAVACGVGALLWWLHARHFESTDDAFVDADVTHVAPQVAGRVTRVLVGDNDEVKEGQTLVEINAKDFQLKVEQAQASRAEAEARQAQSEAQIATAQAQVEQAAAEVTVAVANATNAESDLKRYQSLSREAVSQQQLDAASMTARSTAAQLQAAQKKQAAGQAQVRAAQTEAKAAAEAVRTAGSAVEQAQVQLSYTKVVAHRAGRITNKSVAPGDYLQIGQQLLAIVPHEVWVTANFKETQLTDVRPGEGVTVHVDAYPGDDFRGTVQSIQSGTGARFSLLPPENATGNYVKVVQRVPVKITFDEPADKVRKLAPGMSVVPKVTVR